MRITAIAAMVFGQPQIKSLDGLARVMASALMGERRFDTWLG